MLDDLQEIENAVVLKELDELLVRAPEQLHVVLSSRADPRLRLHRLRLTGELVEIGADELAFTPAECKMLLDAAAADLTDDGVEALWERTRAGRPGCASPLSRSEASPTAPAMSSALPATTAQSPTTS